MHKLSLLVVPALLLVVASSSGCGSKQAQTAESCGPVAVTVDGKPLDAMPKGFARTTIMGDSRTLEVEVFNHDQTTCEEMISRKGRNVPEGELSVRAFAGGSGMMGKGVGIESHTQAGGDVSIVGDKPKAAGDVVSICVGNVSFKPRVGAYKDKQVTVKGLFTGTYCGELTF
ncbi:MAG: hypothetical protein M3680_30040 [Myxococcota bacterium]|nr:hypothetical protein [Myxococcota bacterium]